MNIVKFLERDHQKLDRELAGIRRGLQEAGLADKVDQLVSHCELHESVVHRIFSLLEVSPQNGASEWTSSYKTNHDQMWNLLARLRDSLWTKDIFPIQSAFFNFHSFIAGYLRIERLSLFPTLQSIVKESIRKELGLRAEKHYLRFFHPAIQ